MKLSSIIAPAFYDLHRKIHNDRYTHFWIKGGRGSTKSSFVSIEIILGITEDCRANAVVLRKTRSNIRDSVFEQLLWAIDMLELTDFFSVKPSFPEIVYIPTGQKIIFRGADDPRKIKSAKFKNGYAKFIWYEEADEFNGAREIRIINQSLLRGGKSFKVFYTYNPPMSSRSWVNNEVLKTRSDKVVHHSTYLDVPEGWLGSQFIKEAEHIKKTDFDTYRHEYLGEVTGTGGEVFRNLKIREITDEETAQFDRVYRGLDWGYAADPLHYTVNYYDSRKRRLFIFYEIHKTGMSNFKAAELIKRENKTNAAVICDSAEPKSIGEIASYGIKAVPARKGPRSVEYGIKWLCALEEIVIDPVRCPNTAREFMGYELERDKNGEFRDGYPDRNNHSIDAVRYSLEYVMNSVKVR